ncbi:uncharacterized protein An08g11280 [Aspergillus niger]|uniref:Contig An08c0280, genomic contig n=2 Tax=Aspergillus niger TaxID=5061 RepID=A2QSM7_ASPNC|nr:uncharacterized protein An08g11280 [Aspergillus niger]CAK45799.1 unnamed protein product [Aspergillus niger]
MSDRPRGASPKRESGRAGLRRSRVKEVWIRKKLDINLIKVNTIDKVVKGKQTS